MVKLPLLAVVIGLAAAHCRADDLYMTMPLASHHFGTDGMVNLNGINPGLGLERRNGNLSYGAGAYRNSLFRTSVYAEASYVPLHLGPAHIGGTLGVATGYDSHPVITGFAIARFNRFDLLLAPKSPGRAPGLIGLRLTGKF